MMRYDYGAFCYHYWHVWKDSSGLTCSQGSMWMKIYGSTEPSMVFTLFRSAWLELRGTDFYIDFRLGAALNLKPDS